MTSVEKIHHDGGSFYTFPLKVYFLPHPEEEQDMLVVSVPKRLFKRAVKRNLIRRRIRESFRLGRSCFPGCAGKHILIVYTHPAVLEYDRISEAVRSALGKIQ